MTERSAQVWFGERLVGNLRADDHHELYFQYAKTWLEQKPFAISITLPLTTDENLAHPFFSGLLPEGGARERLCREKGIDPRDDVGLLFAIGEDCAGALSIISADRNNKSRELAEPLSLS